MVVMVLVVSCLIINEDDEDIIIRRCKPFVVRDAELTQPNKLTSRCRKLIASIHPLYC